jgi:hypothetical protein
MKSLKKSARELRADKIKNRTEKRCGKCRKIKSLRDFHKDKIALDGASCYCKSCRLKKLPVDNNLKNKYNITKQKYNEMLKEQSYACKLCCKPHLKDGKVLQVDHDHETGKVRGLLCHACNNRIEYKSFESLAFGYLV